ncbi:MAG: DUF1501 domain-containing protein [Gemmataceae bacterium]|nr:DUF1501 domain-containing protein [Gemmataceae bacterium]
MHPLHETAQAFTRRHFFRAGAMGLGAAALSSLSAPGANAPGSPGLPGLPHFAPKAKRAIYLFMSEGPSQIDTWDHKPKLDALFDKETPKSVLGTQRLTTMTSGQGRLPVAPSKYRFSPHGKNRTMVSELLPWTAKLVDDLCLVKSVWTEAINHDPAITYICTGNQIPGRPSLGSWLSYGLGTMNADLPAFVVMTPSWTGRKEAQALFSRLWSAGTLPSAHQGVALRAKGDPVLYLSNPDGVTPTVRRRMLDSLARLNKKHLDEAGDPETQARIAQYEMAFRMQSSVPELMDTSKEPRRVKEMYGPEVDTPGTFAYCCLMARRMMERGVRFVQLFHRGWDQHAVLPTDLPNQCRDIDKPTHGLITDLKQRGLLDDTLVVWGGEFGRTVYCQGKLTRKDYGRDHHPRCFPMWLCGAGVKPGIVHGETDDFSYNIVRDPVHIHEMNATILHCLGIDHKRLTVKSQGLDVRLTGVEDVSPVKALLA